MDVNTVSGVSSTLYTRGATLNNANTVTIQNTKTEQATLSSSYRVSLSSEGIDRSKAQFESRQANDVRAFDRGQVRDEQSKERELSADRRQFDREQASEKRRFEAEQRIEKMRFARNKSQ